MDTEKPSIVRLMDEIEAMEKYISQCEHIEFSQRKRWARCCREVINKYTAILVFIREFLPNFMSEKQDKK